MGLVFVKIGKKKKEVIYERCYFHNNDINCYDYRVYWINLFN